MTDITTTPTDPATRVLQLLDETLGHTPGFVVLCLGCVGDRVQAAQHGAQPEDWPEIRFAALIVAGNGMCLRHVQFAERPVMPGQTPSGLYLGTTGQAV